MPLYACDRCGFTSAVFRIDAVSDHRREYPYCEGTLQIIFRSDERYHGRTRNPQPAGRPTAAAKSGKEPSRVRRLSRSFQIRERVDGDKSLRLILLGDLDFAVAEKLVERLRELKATGRPVRLDLSALAFIDSAGVQALLVALTDARWDRWRLEVARQISPSVERAVQIVGIERALWPEDPRPKQAR